MKLNTVLEINGMKTNAVLYKGKTKANLPKSYKKVDVVGHDIGGWTSDDYLTIYKNSRGGLVYEVYIKGSIFPFYGRLEILN